MLGSRDVDKRLLVDTEASRTCARDLAGNPYLAGEDPADGPAMTRAVGGSAAGRTTVTGEYYLENSNNDPLPR